MLGLGGSLLFSNFLPGGLIFEYTSDFTSGVDGWEEYSLTEGSPTISGNDSGPDGAGGWLKMEFDQDQTDVYGGLRRDLGWTARAGTPEMRGTKKYDYAEIRFKIHLVETGSDHWGGSDDVSLTVGALGDGVSGPYASDEPAYAYISQNQTNEVFITRRALFETTGGCQASGSTPDYSPCSYADGIRLTFQVMGDKPANGAIFYIKDYNIKIYR